MTVEVWGGGGGGAGNKQTEGANVGGGGGGAGGYCSQTISVTPGATISYTVGLGGAGGTGNFLPGNGQSSTFSSVTASGGSGATSSTGAGGAGGAGCTTNGGNGSSGTSTTGGSGGASPNGGAGGAGGAVNSDGSNGTAPGGGGGGAGDQTTGGNEAGGDGGSGQIKVTYTANSYLLHGGTSCATAGSMTSGATYGGDFCEADNTQTFASTNACGITPDDELWYSISVPAGCSYVDVDITNNTTGEQLSVEFWGNNTVGSINTCPTTYLNLGDACGTNPTATAGYVTMPAGGGTLWVRVSGATLTGTFDITPTITPEGANNSSDGSLCTAPYNLTLGDGLNTSGTNTGYHMTSNYCAGIGPEDGTTQGNYSVSGTTQFVNSACSPSLENSQYFSFTVPTGGDWNLFVGNQNCVGTNGIQLVVRQSLDCDGTPSYGTNDDITCRSTAGTGDFQVTLTGLVANTTYYIIIDGFGGDDCQYDILISQYLILPISIKTIKATNLGKTNLIEWVTESEVNNDYQIVERSKNGVDSWAEIGKVKGSTGSDGTRSYSINDNDPYDITYYRIHSVDLDGKEGFSDVVYARSGSIKNGMLHDILPNPAVESINVLMNLSETVNPSIRITDFTGRLFFYDRLSNISETTSYSVDLTGWPTGMYFVKVESNGKSEYKRFLKK